MIVRDMHCKSSMPGTALSTILGIKQRRKQTPILMESTLQRDMGKTVNKRNKENMQDDKCDNECGEKWSRGVPGGSEGVAELSRVVKEGLSEKVPFEPRPEGYRGVCEEPKETSGRGGDASTVCLAYPDAKNPRRGAFFRTAAHYTCAASLPRAPVGGWAGLRPHRHHTCDGWPWLVLSRGLLFLQFHLPEFIPHEERSSWHCSFHTSSHAWSHTGKNVVMHLCLPIGLTKI